MAVQEKTVTSVTQREQKADTTKGQRTKQHEEVPLLIGEAQRDSHDEEGEKRSVRSPALTPGEEQEGDAQIGGPGMGGRNTSRLGRRLRGLAGRVGWGPTSR